MDRPPKSLEEIEAEAEQFQRDNTGWKAIVDEHGNTFYINPYINNGRGNTQKPAQYIITQAAEAAKAGPPTPGPPPYPPPPLLPPPLLPPPPPRQRSLHSRSARVLAEAEVKSREIDLVCVVSGHSFCSKEKIRLPPNVCVLTLSLLEDYLISGSGEVTREVKELVEKSSSPSLTVSSFIDMAKKIRDDKKTVYPQKVRSGSIRARCGSVNPKEQSTVTNQRFFGGARVAEETEGVFMVEFPEEYLARNLKLMQKGMTPMPPMPSPLNVDISSKVTPYGASLLTRQPHGDNPTPSGKNEYTYKKTTKFQERIIQLESGNPDETVSSSVEYNEEMAKLYEQRSLFCRSLNFGDDFRLCIESCKGIDVMFLQHCYDCIVKWERQHRRCAHEFFTQVDPSSQVRPGLEHFIVENSLPDEEKTRDALIMLSEKRKLQREKFIHGGAPQNRHYAFLYDNQLVQSLYLAKTCENIVQDLHRMFPERKILVILDGCRGTGEYREPYASDHGEEDDDGELFNEEGEGGARQKKIKNTNQKKKKTHKKKTHKKKTHKKKTYKKKINNSFKNKK